MNPPPNLNPLARLYRWMEWFTFGPALDRCRRAFLPHLLHSRRALALGDGDGRFTARLLRANRQVRIDAVDASYAMLRLLVRRAGPHAVRLRAHCADARLWQPSGQPTFGQPYDLVYAHFFLDFLTPGEVRALARRLRPAVSPSALWVVSEFVIPPTLFGRFVARPVVAALYRGFGLLTGLKVRRLPNHPRALARRLRPAVSPSALWVVSEFVIPPTLFGRFVARPVVAALYRGFGLLTGLKVRRLPNHPRALARSGFTLLRRRTFLCGLLASELWQPSPVPAPALVQSPAPPLASPAKLLQTC